MTDKEYILQLMHMALIDILIYSQRKKYFAIFVISDVFRTIPLQINSADRGEMDYAEIITWIRKKCEERNCLK